MVNVVTVLAAIACLLFVLSLVPTWTASTVLQGTAGLLLSIAVLLLGRGGG